ncbi:hypothetical protein RUA4292_00471 [Ruegeria atlantica]|uniref:DDE domain-containing protein n=1 Tax=Ruegeria atlantica TaxID=81569 RepID=A0A0P1EUM5_9RHOB|nr:hypothetical protein RUA4292_00471 [Ruegeria atlantica]
MLESYVTKGRNRKAALKLLRKSMKRYGQPEVIMADKLRSYGAAVRSSATRLQEVPPRESVAYLPELFEASWGVLSEELVVRRAGVLRSFCP